MYQSAVSEYVFVHTAVQQDSKRMKNIKGLNACAQLWQSPLAHSTGQSKTQDQLRFKGRRNKPHGTELFYFVKGRAHNERWRIAAILQFTTSHGIY